MHQVFAHDAVLATDPDADIRAPGAAITVALCGHWEHEPPCPLAPHHVDAARVDNGVQVRILFATEPEHEAEVRRRLEQALSGQVDLPPGLAISWRLQQSGPSQVLAEESEQAEGLLRV